MRILHIITSLKTGGAEKLIVDLLPRMREKDHNVELLVFDGTETQFKQELENCGIKIHDLGHGGSVYAIRRLYQLRKYLKGYDIIHSHNYAPQLFTGLRSFGLTKKTKFITTEHNTSNRRRSKPIFKWIDRWMYNRYDSVICISEKTEDNLKSFIRHSQANILTIPNGVDVKKYSKAVASQELEKIAPGSRKISMVAGFRWEKDHPTVIKAMKHLPNNFHLFLIGDGVRRDEYEQLISDLDLNNRVHLMGIRNDVAELLHASDYCVVSSHIEGFGLISVEAMASKRPLLASDVDGLREVVSGAGILFPHENAEALANEILQLDNNKQKYHDVAEKCFLRAQQYDISKMVDGYLRVYKSL